MVGRKKRLQTVGEMQIAPALHIQLEYSRRIPCERSVAGMIVTRLDLHADNASRNHKQDSNENDNSCAPLSGAVLGRSLAVLGPCWALLDLLCAVLSCQKWLHEIWTHPRGFKKLTEMVVMGFDIENDKAIKDQKLSGN